MVNFLTLHADYLRRVGPLHAELVPVGNALAFTSTFDAGLVAAFKAAIPPEGRQWDKANRRWLVSPQYGKACADLAATYLGVMVMVPSVASAVAIETRLVKLEYLGRAKDRQGGEPSAFGWADGAWSLVFPETVLREWFEAVPAKPGELPTLYAALGVKQEVDEPTLRSAYRRMARLWHPDVNKEEDAAEQFKVIQHAWEVIGEPTLRRKYDVGLRLQAAAKVDALPTRSAWADPSGFRAPLRCGYVLVEGQVALARYVVSRILQWEDVTRADGKIMVSSWVMGADKPEVVWA